MSIRTFAVRASALAVLALPAFGQALSGTYVVGPGGAYPNIAAAGAALVANGVSGPTIFQVTANDVGPWTFPAITGQGAANPIVFDGGGVTTISGTSPVLTLSGCAYVTFSGFVASFTTGPFVTVSGATANCTFKNCLVSAPVSTSGSTTTCFNLVGGSNCVIEDCAFGGGYEAFNMGTAFNGLLVQRNRIQGGGFWAARIGGANCTFRNNFVATTSQYGLSCGVSGSPLATTNMKIHNNSFYSNHPTSSSQFDVLRWYSDAANNTEVLNNAIHEIHVNATGGHVMWCSGVLRPTVMNYNVFHLVNGLSFVAASGNLTFAQWQALGFDANSLLGDPLYVAPTGTPPDLSIQQGSPCIGVGTSIPTVTDDFFGNPRGGVYDIGAHQLGAANILSFVTSGGGVGDLFVSITDLDANAVSGYTLISADTSHPYKSGPFFGMWPDFTTWSILTDPNPAFPGNPLHFVCNVPGVFPATPLTVPAGTLSFLGGSSWDVIALILGPGNSYVGVSNLVRVLW